jgi:phage terminase small subunit
MKHSQEEAQKNVTEYIHNRLAGANKMKSAIEAGYSETTARNPTLIESTKAYMTVQTQILEKNNKNLYTIQEIVTEALQKEPKDLVMAETASRIGKNLTGIYTAMMPKVTLKESTDKNGNVTRTAWAQNASQVQEVLQDKEDIEEEK